MDERWPYYPPPGHTISYRESMELAGRRLPYLAAEFKQSPTGLYRPDYYEYFLVTGGEGRRTFRGADGELRRDRLAPGDLYFFRPRDLQEIVGVGRAGITVICVAFPVQTWEKFAMAAELDQRIFWEQEPPRLDIDLSDTSKMRPFRRILKAYPRRLDGLDLLRFLVETTPWFVEAARSDDPSGAPRWLRTAVAAMHEEKNMRGGVQRLIELSHVSHTHLWRHTHTYFGVSPSRLVNEIRIHHAALLLTSTDTPIALIAERCGFGNAGHFSTAFRRSRLVSPREYRVRSRTR